MDLKRSPATSRPTPGVYDGFELLEYQEQATPDFEIRGLGQQGYPPCGAQGRYSAITWQIMGRASAISAVRVA